MWSKAVLLLCFCLPISLSTHAIAAHSADTATVELTTAFLIETGPRLNPSTAAELWHKGQFTPYADTLALGLGSKPVWIALKLHNDTGRQLERSLLLDTAWLDEIRLYHYRGPRLHHQVVAGDLQPFANRNPLLTGFLFPLELSPGEHFVLLRVSTPDPMLLPLRLLDDEQLEHLPLQRLTSYGLSYGFLLALIFYNTALFFGIRDRHHLLYALYLGSFLLVNLAYSGHGLAWFWSDATEWQRWAPPALMILFGCCGLLFATSFLHIRQYCSRGYRVVQLAAALALLSLTAGWLLDSQLVALSAAFMFMLVFTSLMLLMGLCRVTQGSVSARFYLLAVISGTCGTVITTLAVLGRLPLGEWSFRAAEIGMLAEATLLALALAARIRHVHREQIRAEHAADTDPLTLLNNRRALYRLAESHWQTGNRRRRPLSAVVLDIDHFKQCNDTYGHAAGDRVLCQLGQCILNTVREGDLAARWGGEEFLILLPDTDLEDAGRFAARLLEQIRLTQLTLNGRLIEVTASIGIAEQSEQDRSLDDLIGRADQALYEAKHQGRNRIFRQQMGTDGNDQFSEVLIHESAG